MTELQLGDRVMLSHTGMRVLSSLGNPREHNVADYWTQAATVQQILGQSIDVCFDDGEFATVHSDLLELTPREAVQAPPIGFAILPTKNYLGIVLCWQVRPFNALHIVEGTMWDKFEFDSKEDAELFFAEKALSTLN